MLVSSQVPEDVLKAGENGTVQLEMGSGTVFTLTPVEASAFWKQSDKVSVRTRIGDTNLNNGATATSGSSLMLSTMKNTKQYSMPMAAFSWKSDVSGDEAAGAVGKIGRSTILLLDGKSYTPMWGITFDADLGFSTKETQEGFDLIFLVGDNDRIEDLTLTVKDQ